MPRLNIAVRKRPAAGSSNREAMDDEKSNLQIEYIILKV